MEHEKVREIASKQFISEYDYRLMKTYYFQMAEKSDATILELRRIIEERIREYERMKSIDDSRNRTGRNHLFSFWMSQ